MATKLKVVEQVADIVPAPTIPEFASAPTRKQKAGWTAERQRKFIEHLALTGHVGEACGVVGVSSSSAYRLKHKPGAEGFSDAWDAALRLAATTRLPAIAFDRALNGRVERFYKNGELVVERRIPSDYLLTWLLSRLNPLQFGLPTAKALAAATGDPCNVARKEMPALVDSFEDVTEEECPAEGIDFLDDRLGEAGSGEPISDDER
jgi:hypothetical protein